MYCTLTKPSYNLIVWQSSSQPPSLLKLVCLKLSTASRRPSLLLGSQKSTFVEIAETINPVQQRYSYSVRMNNWCSSHEQRIIMYDSITNLTTASLLPIFLFFKLTSFWLWNCRYCWRIKGHQNHLERWNPERYNGNPKNWEVRNTWNILCT